MGGVFTVNCPLGSTSSVSYAKYAPIDVNDGKWPAWHYAQYMTLRDFPTWQYIYVLVIAITMVMRFWQYINGRG